MTKFLAFVLSFIVLSAQARAAAGSDEALKAAFDELNFALTVEWDQKDQSVYHKEVDKFQDKIVKLKNAGLTNQELLNFLISNTKDKALAQDLKQFYDVVATQNLTNEEMMSMSNEMMNRHYARGSAWAGQVLLIGVGVIVILAGVIAFKLWQIDWKSKHCTTDLYCDHGTCWEENEQCH